MLKLAALMSFVPRELRRFADDRRGVSAVEFAMLLPLMLTLYFGAVEISQGVTIDRKVTLTTRTVADLVSQVSANITTTEMNNVLDASAAVMSPFSTVGLKMTITCVRTDNNGASKVGWSVTRNGTAHAANAAVTLPSAIKINNSTLIWSQVEYIYTPTIGYVVTGPLTLADQMYMRPRLSDTIGYGNATCT